MNAGTHAITAYVEMPESENAASLPWLEKNATALADVLFLLSLFTGREVFVVDESFYDVKDIGITADPRIYRWGGILQCSIPYEKKSTAQDFSNVKFYRIIDTEEGEKWIPTEPPPDPSGYNIGFEKGLNRIYDLIRSEEWQKTYQGGYFLFLARSAFRPQTLEASFIQCSTIWEHLFALLNKTKSRKRTPIEDKIEYLLVHFDLAAIMSPLKKG